MLKSYKKLDRWYDPLEPQDADSAPERTNNSVTSDTVSADDGGAARYPDYISADEIAPEDMVPTRVRTRSAESVVEPTELSERRSGFTGGWSDWVTDPEPGAADDGDLVQFPWADSDAQPARIGRAAGRSDDAEAKARRRRTIGVLAAAVLLLAAAAAVVLYLLAPGASHGSGPDDGAALRFIAEGDRANAGANRCVTERSDTVVRGAERGDTTSGPDVIMRFQYAYYVERSGAAARSVVAPDARVSPAERIQAGIDSVAPGTEYCLRIVTVADGRYSVEITEYGPNDAPATYSKQTVTTAVIDGRTLITGITAG